MQTEETHVKCNDRENAPSAIQILVSSHKAEKAKKLLHQECTTTKTAGHLEGQK